MKPSSARVALAIAGAKLELLRVPIPDSVSKFYDANCSLTSEQQYESTGGQPIVTPDGSVYVEAYIYEDTNDLNCSGRDQYLKATLNLLQVSPEGTPTWSTPFNSVGTEYWDYYMGAIIPDGQGGLLASWAGILHNCGVLCHTDIPRVTHITAAGNSEYALPPNGGYQVSGNGYDPGLSLVLGENGTAFAALTGPLGSQFASLNIAGGTVNWNWTGSSGFADMIAATSGNGLVVKQYTVNGSGQEVNDVVVRLDPTGAATPDSWTGNAVQYAHGDTWLALGSAMDMASGSGFDLAAGFWPTIAGYFFSSNSQPDCPPIEPPATKKLIEDGASALSNFLQTPCPWCKTYVFDKLNITQSNFAAYLAKGHQFCDGTKSKEPGRTINETDATVAAYFKRKNKDVAITVAPWNGPLLVYFNPAFFDSQHPFYQNALVFHEGLHGFGNFGDYRLCLLITDSGEQNRCVGVDTNEFNQWLEDNVPWL